MPSSDSGQSLSAKLWPLINMQTHSVDKPTEAPPLKLTHLNMCILGIFVQIQALHVKPLTNVSICLLS